MIISVMLVLFCGDRAKTRGREASTVIDREEEEEEEEGLQEGLFKRWE